MPLCGLSVFLLSSSTVLSRYWDISVNSMTSWSMTKLPKIAWHSPFNILIHQKAYVSGITDFIKSFTYCPPHARTAIIPQRVSYPLKVASHSISSSISMLARLSIGVVFPHHPFSDVGHPFSFIPTKCLRHIPPPHIALVTEMVPFE